MRQLVHVYYGYCLMTFVGLARGGEWSSELDMSATKKESSEKKTCSISLPFVLIYGFHDGNL